MRTWCRSATIKGKGLIAEQCPHRSASLLCVIPTEHGIRCHHHGCGFRVEGKYLNQPFKQDMSAFRDKMSTDADPVEELGGLLLAYLGPDSM